MNILIESYAKNEHNLIVKLKNGREITLPYSKNIEKKLLNLFIFNKNINYIIGQEKKIKNIQNIDIFGKMVIMDAGMMYSFLNDNMPGILFFLFVVFVTTYADGKVAFNDEEFESRVNYLKSLYFNQEEKIINKLDQEQEKITNEFYNMSFEDSSSKLIKTRKR